MVCYYEVMAPGCAEKTTGTFRLSLLKVVLPANNDSLLLDLIQYSAIMRLPLGCDAHR